MSSLRLSFFVCAVLGLVAAKSSLASCKWESTTWEVHNNTSGQAIEVRPSWNSTEVQQVSSGAQASDVCGSTVHVTIGEDDGTFYASSNCRRYRLRIYGMSSRTGNMLVRKQCRSYR